MLTTSFIKPTIFQAFNEVIATESTRHGGVSEPPFQSLNLGINTADLAANVNKNRQMFFEQLGITDTQFASSFQVHGDKVRLVTQPERTEGYDALICNTPNIFVGVTVADCTPILIYDSKRQSVGAVHAGWRGCAAQIVRKTLEAMQANFGTQPADCYAYIGTCIDYCDFEVGEEVATQFDSKFKQFDTRRGKFLVDLKKANAAQMLDFGVPPQQIQISAYSTITHNADFFSYRLEKGQTGRMLAVIGMTHSKNCP